MQVLLDEGDSPRPGLDAETEAYALRVRQLLQSKLSDLRSALPGGLSDAGSGRERRSSLTGQHCSRPGCVCHCRG